MTKARAKLARKTRRFQGPRQRLRVLLASYWQNEELMEGVAQEAARFGWEMMDRRYFGGLPEAFHPDGILSCTGYDARWEALRRPGRPMVCVGLEDQMPDAGIPLVTEDSARIGRLAAEHFLERGFRAIGFVAQEAAGPGPWDGSPAEKTYAGLKRRVAVAGAACLEPLLLPNVDAAGTGDQRKGRFAAWLKTVPRPVGLLVFRDVFAGHVCALCLQHGVAVPEEVAVLGIGNRRRLCKVSPCPLSSVDTNNAAQGRAAARALQRMMTGAGAPEAVFRIPPRGVVTRRSTDILAVADVDVARALRFLWEHYAEPLGVNDIAAAVGISRSTLERRFRREVGRGVTAELIRKRLERCRELLVTTEDSIQTIAPLVGFHTPTYLQRVFRETFGMTPHKWRVQQRAAAGTRE